MFFIVACVICAVFFAEYQTNLPKLFYDWVVQLLEAGQEEDLNNGSI